MISNKETLESYLNRQFLIYSRSSFQFGEYYVFLYQLIHGLDKKSPTKLIGYLNKFFVCTNLFDDIMDKDNNELENIYNINNEFPLYLKSLLKSIEQQSATSDFLLFIDYISRSLIYQKTESTKTIDIETIENDYFSLYVMPSVFLLQAVVPFANENTSNSLYTSAEYLAYFSQIKNDITNIRQPISNDLLNSRPTLPLIKTIEFGVQESNLEIINKLLYITEEKYNQADYDEIIQYIYENEILEYCAKLALHFFNRAKEELILHFPDKRIYITSFFAHLTIKDVKNDS